MEIRQYWQLDFDKNEENKKKVVAKVVDFLDFDISATECPIEIKFSVPDSADQGLQHIPL